MRLFNQSQRNKRLLGLKDQHLNTKSSLFLFFPQLETFNIICWTRTVHMGHCKQLYLRVHISNIVFAFKTSALLSFLLAFHFYFLTVFITYHPKPLAIPAHIHISAGLLYCDPNLNFMSRIDPLSSSTCIAPIHVALPSPPVFTILMLHIM